MIPEGQSKALIQPDNRKKLRQLQFGELIAEALQQSVFGIYIKAAIVIAEFSAVIQLHVYLCENMSQPVFSQKAQGQTGGGVVAPFLVRPAAFFDLAAQKSRYLAEQLVDQGIRHVYGCFRGDDLISNSAKSVSCHIFCMLK